VHEHHPDVVRACDRGGSVGASGPVVVDAADPHPIERRCEPNVAIGQHLDARLFESTDDMLGTRPPVMIAQDGEAPEGSWNITELGEQPFGLRQVQRNEIAAEQQDIRRGRAQLGTRDLQEGRIGRRSRVEIRGKGQLQPRQTGRPVVDDDIVPDGKHFRPNAERPSQAERPRAPEEHTLYPRAYLSEPRTRTVHASLMVMAGPAAASFVPQPGGKVLRGSGTRGECLRLEGMGVGTRRACLRADFQFFPDRSTAQSEATRGARARDGDLT
jgi:hypothetical protein